MKKPFFLCTAFLAQSLTVIAGLSLSPIYGANAVFQRDLPLAIRGKGDSGSRVRVAFAGQTAETTVTNNRWRVVLSPIPAGGPFVLEVSSGDERISRSGILMGDVWLCSGQSNMATPLRYYINRNGRSDAEWAFFQKIFSGIPGEYRNPRIRFVQVSPTVRGVPIENPKLASAQWMTCDPLSCRELSAVAYFFARRLQPEIGVPIGLVVAAVGGTPAQAWVPGSVIDSRPQYRPIREYYERQMKSYPERKREYDRQAQAYREKNGMRRDEPINPYAPGAPRIPYGPEHNQRPTGLFNGMIAPLQDTAFKGAVWYQGEADAYSLQGVKIYRDLFPDLIRCWRNYFHQPDLPFLYVQLPGYQSPRSKNEVWPAMRAAQAEAEKSVPGTAMVVAIDGGLEHNIHPPFKQLVGERLAQAALATVYGSPVPSGGPRFEAAEFEGRRIVLHFSRIGNGLEARDVALGLDGKYKIGQGALRGFSIAGSDGLFVPAKAVIDGDTVIVRHDEISEPVSVRYAWADFPRANLYNADGFPTGPFSASKP